MIITGLQACAPNGATVVTLGTFDGLHRGHRALFEKVKTSAHQRGLKSLVLTFPQPPQNHINGKPKKPLILPPAKKLEMIEGCGIETVVMAEFEEISRMSPSEFARQVLKERLHATEVVVGYDCRFGKDRGGDAQTLRALGAELGFNVHVVEPVVVDGVIVSSTEVRRAIEAGEVERAARLLGYAPLLCGHVIMEVAYDASAVQKNDERFIHHQDARSRRERTNFVPPRLNGILNRDGRARWNWPPVHLGVDERLVAPKEGFFLLGVSLQGREQPAVMSVRQCPSLGNHDRRFQIHWLHRELELVPHAQLEIRLLKGLQGMQVFEEWASNMPHDLTQDLQQAEWACQLFRGRASGTDGT